MSAPGESTPVTITVRDNGNYRVAGPITLLDGEGNALEIEAGKAVFLCRCGGSATKPFCDGTHRTNGFSSVVRAGWAAGEAAAAEAAADATPSAATPGDGTRT